MIDFEVIKALSKVGDSCSLEDSKNGSITGQILVLSENTIVIEDKNGKKAFFSGSNIDHFELVSSNNENPAPTNSNDDKTNNAGSSEKKEKSIPKEKFKTIGRDLNSLAIIKSQKSSNESEEDWYFLSKIVPLLGLIILFLT